MSETKNEVRVVQPLVGPPEEKPKLTPEEEKMRDELNKLWGQTVLSAQKVAYELATLEPKESYSASELKDLFEACKELVRALKSVHKIIEKASRR
jgi:predicted nucleic acid-binding protein